MRNEPGAARLLVVANHAPLACLGTPAIVEAPQRAAQPSIHLFKEFAASHQLQAYIGLVPCIPCIDDFRFRLQCAMSQHRIVDASPDDPARGRGFERLPIFIAVERND
jgi:hypothetical protein